MNTHLLDNSEVNITVDTTQCLPTTWKIYTKHITRVFTVTPKMAYLEWMDGAKKMTLTVGMSSDADRDNFLKELKHRQYLIADTQYNGITWG